jgi:hypothetical protein
MSKRTRARRTPISRNKSKVSRRYKINRILRRKNRKRRIRQHGKTISKANKI